MRNWLITLLLFSGIVLGMSTFFGATSSQFGITTTDTAFINTTQQVFDNTEDLQDIINQTEGDVTLIGTVAVTTNAVIQFLKILMFVPTLLASIVADISTFLMLPVWFVPMIIGIIIVIVIFQIMSGIGRYRT